MLVHGDECIRENEFRWHRRSESSCPIVESRTRAFFVTKDSAKHTGDAFDWIR